MKKFKYKLAYKVSSQQEAIQLASDLNKLGYPTESIYNGDVEKGNAYLQTFFNWNEPSLGLFYSAQDRKLITNKDLFLALAAMVDDEKFHVDEYVMFLPEVAKSLGYYTIGYWNENTTICKIIKTDNSGKDSPTLYRKEGGGSNSHKCFRKATKEEIEQHFNTAASNNTCAEINLPTEEPLIMGKWKAGELVHWDNNPMYVCKKWSYRDLKSYNTLTSDKRVWGVEIENGIEYLLLDYSSGDKISNNPYMVPKSELLAKGIIAEDLTAKEDQLLFKVGDQFMAGVSSTVYTITAINNGYVELYWDKGKSMVDYTIKDVNRYFTEGTWVLYNQPIKQETKMNREFTVEGSKYLKQALVNELKEVGYRTLSDNTSEQEGYLAPTLDQIDSIMCRSNRKSTHYILPQDYDKAKEAFLALKVPEYVKCVSWVGTNYTAGAFYKVNADGSITNNQGNNTATYKHSSFTRATKEEYDAYQESIKPKEVTIIITTCNGDHELIIEKDIVRYDSYMLSINKINELKDFLTVPDLGNKVIAIRPTLEIGCRGQIKGVTDDHLVEVLSKHEATFGS